ENLAREALARCCGSQLWAERMAEARPFGSPAGLHEAAEQGWWGLSQEGWLGGVGRHPPTGGPDSLRRQVDATAERGRGEQAAVGRASEATLVALAQGNRRYEEKFGFIFIVCATGKSAEEMLALLESRLGHVPSTEIRVAAGEQARITRLRLEKLLSEEE